MSTPIAPKIRLAADTAELDAALALRHRVFCVEQGVAVELEVDGRDGGALHVVAVSDGAVVGTCRLVFDGETAKLGRMAVEPWARGQGIGAALLAGAEREAGAAGALRVSLHAQARARDLYARAGFNEQGDRFEEAGIEHVLMEKRLEENSVDRPRGKGRSA
jgi:predicted GNAT family N-acyltransferase